MDSFRLNAKDYNSILNRWGIWIMLLLCVKTKLDYFHIYGYNNLKGK